MRLIKLLVIAAALVSCSSPKTVDTKVTYVQVDGEWQEKTTYYINGREVTKPVQYE